MYMKKRKNSLIPNNSLLKVNVPLVDRDSGIMTDSDVNSQMLFSDDDEVADLNRKHATATTSISSVFNSPTHYASAADIAVSSLRQTLKDQSWKKVLKHKSGTTVYMASHQKMAYFKGENIIEGFSPQSIFYVIGMRKLWDEQFDEGRLIENLNDTTSLTYESYKSSTTSKAYDMTLVEKIDCSVSGEILFVCTSVDTPNVPKVPGKNRQIIKLQGWILKPLNTSPISTKVTYLTQENIKGWIPGLTKKSLARKPLIISSVANYLKSKAVRTKLQHQQKREEMRAVPTPSSSTSSSSTIFNDSIPPRPRQPSSASINNLPLQSYNHQQQQQQQQQQQLSLSRTSNTSSIQSNTTTNTTINNNNTKKSNLISNPPPRHSSLSTGSRTNSATVKHISFADDVLTPRSSSSTYSSPSVRSSTNELNTICEEDTAPPPPKPAPTGLYASSRHRSIRQSHVNKLKEYLDDTTGWKEMEPINKTKIYTKHLEGFELPILKSEATILGSWTPEQICSVIQCFGARKIWDEHFQDGHIIDRFSQKEYLVHTQMKSIFPIQSRDFSLINSIDSINNVIYLCSSSVEDELIPVRSKVIRGRILISGWVLEPIKRDNKLWGVKTTFLHHMDMQGTISLPPAIVRQLTQERCLDRVQSYLRQSGCPPYIRRVTGKVIFEDFDTQHKIYTIEYIVKFNSSNRVNWYTDLRIHQSTFPFGYLVDASPGLEVEEVKSGIRVVTRDAALDGKTVQIQIREKALTKDVWNDNKELVRASSQGPIKKEERKIDVVESLPKVDVKKVEVEKVKNECIKKDDNKTQFMEQSSNAVIIITDELSFTAQQFSFVLLLMMICYYLGKFSCSNKCE